MGSVSFWIGLEGSRRKAKCRAGREFNLNGDR